MNEDIAAPLVLLIGNDGAAIGSRTRQEALRIAREAGLELVEVQPGADPPVCKLIPVDRVKDGSDRPEPREVRTLAFRPGASEPDIELRLRHAHAFLESGGAVELRVERADGARELLARLIDCLEHVGTARKRERYTEHEVVQMLEPCAPVDEEE